MEVLWIIGGFLLGRALSLAVYRVCWCHGERMDQTTSSAIGSLLRQPVPWLLHGLVMASLYRWSWQEMPHLRAMAMTLVALLALGAVGRMGATGRGKHFMGDRLVILLLSAAVWYQPVWLYPCVIACCALQYRVASWRLGPGYSNLLGYEFVRASLCVIMAAMALQGLPGWCGGAFPIREDVMIAACLLYQASTYFHHAVAKCALGPRWFSWMRENRIECLFANAWLRGWTLGLDKQRCFTLCQWIARKRRWLCAGVWLLEVSWVFLLADARLAVVILAATVVFHGIVFLSTGLLAYEYAVNHLFLIGLILWCDGRDIFGAKALLASVLVMPLAAAWVGWLRLGMLASFQQQGTGGHRARFADAADHLMAWWDTPLMRMFSYTVETTAGKRYTLPVPRISPYDTFLTDIHTHLMILGQHTGLDPAAPRDRGIARTGVWGLTIHREDRDFLYRLMDGPDDAEPLHLSPSPPAWSMTVGETHVASPLAGWMANVNHHKDRWWFRWLMRWPHIPGEDLAPDLCPLRAKEWPCFDFDETIASVTIWRIKTFYHHTGLHLISEEPLGCILSPHA